MFKKEDRGLPGLTLLLLAATSLIACTPVSPATARAPEPERTGAAIAVGTGLGQLAPPFSVTTIDGRAITDATVRATAKPYILYFYATW